MVKFEVGQCYHTRLICDSNCILSYLVLKRSEKMVTLQDKFGRVRRRKIDVEKDCEYLLPEGNHSMAPVLSADSTLPGEGQNLKERTELLERAKRQEIADSRMAWKTAQQINSLFSIA